VTTLSLIYRHQESTIKSFGPKVELFALTLPGLSVGLGLDQLSLAFISLSVFLMPLIYFIGVKNLTPEQRNSSFIHFSLISAAFFGSILATDIFLYYVCWELVVVILFLHLLKLGQVGKYQAAFKMLYYSVGASLFMLTGFLLLAHAHYAQTSILSFSIADLASIPLGFEAAHPFVSAQFYVFCCLLVAFMVKGHIFPLHGWLPDVYKEGTTLSTGLLSAILFNMAAYSMLRFFPKLTPDVLVWSKKYLMLLGAAGLIYGALSAWRTTSMMRLFAFMGISHMGLFFMGFAAQSVNALSAVFIQTINHGVIAAGVFVFFTGIEYIYQTKDLKDVRGVAQSMPMLALVAVIILMSNTAVPGTNGFVGEFLVLLSSFEAYPMATILASTGVILSALYTLKILKLSIWGEENKNVLVLPGNADYIKVLFIIASLVLIIGIMPQLFFPESLLLSITAP
jgi:NADH-quinone oxidoreductase subunit M